MQFRVSSIVSYRLLCVFIDCWWPLQRRSQHSCMTTVYLLTCCTRVASCSTSVRHRVHSLRRTSTVSLLPANFTTMALVAASVHALQSWSRLPLDLKLLCSTESLGPFYGTIAIPSDMRCHCCCRCGPQVVDIDFTLPFTRCRYCRTRPAL